MVLVLNKEEQLEELMEVFVEMGVGGATIIDSIGMGRIVSHDIPIFAGFRTLMQDTRPGNKTIFTVVREEMLEGLIEAIEQVTGTLDNPGNGVLFTIALHTVKGIG